MKLGDVIRAKCVYGGKAYVTVGALDNFANQEQADDAEQGLLGAEVIEILMNYRNENRRCKLGIRTRAMAKDSRVAAATLHPVGYCTVLGAPFVHTWLQSNRTDYINTNDPTDIAPISLWLRPPIHLLPSESAQVQHVADLAIGRRESCRSL